MSAQRLAAALVASVLALGLTACTAGSAPKHDATAKTSPASALVATRWWSNRAVSVGSRIDAGHPDAAVAKLHPSRTDYCGMLSQTLAAGKSILPGATATDPALRDSTIAFVGELHAVAPAEITASWQVLGNALVSLVQSGGTTAVHGVNSAAVRKAAAAVEADAKTSCHLDLSAHR